MSNVAMTPGLEWNVKLSEKESFEIITKINATFETYWNDTIFETFDNSEKSRKVLKSALNKSDIDFSEANKKCFIGGNYD